MIRSARSYPAAIGGSGLVATVVSAGALAGSFSVHGEMAVAFLLGSFSCALAGGVLLLGSAKVARDAERRAVERRLAESESRHRALVEHAPFCIMEIDASGRVVASNPACVELLAGAGMPLVEVFAKSERPRLERVLDSAFGGGPVVAELRTGDDARHRLLAASFIPLAGGGAETARVMGVLQDVTEAREAAARLEQQARLDALTGLVNRREFTHRLERVLETSTPGDAEHALCYIDLDQFKVINDTSGHIAGDELLRQVGALLQRCVRRRDTLARLGGDEFGVLMEHCTLDHALRAAEKMRRVLEEFRFQWADRTFSIGASIGVVAVDGAERELERVLDAADRACYMAKDGGRNRVHVLDASAAWSAPPSGESEWLSRLHRALDEDGLALALQPIVPNPPGGGEGRLLELFVRMPNQAGGESLPGAFLPAAQRHGLTARIDDWVVARGIEWLEAVPGRLDDVALCAINLGAATLVDEPFLAAIGERLRGRRALARHLCFEITETAAIGNLAATTRFMYALRGLGCRFALDDFGSGLSSFAYLKSLPVDFLKIDGVFVRDMARSRVDRAMVRAIADIGREMGMRTIAEFVEDEETAQLTRELGIDYVQGNWVGPPRPLERVDEAS